MHDHSQAWVRSTCRCLACSWLQVGSKSFMDILITPQFYSRIGNQGSTLPKYWQPIPQKCSYVHLMSLEYFSVSLSGQGQQIIPDVVMSRDFTIASNSNVPACQHWWSLYWLCSSSISGLPSSFWARWIINHLFYLWNIDQGNCLRLLILFVTWSLHLTSLIWTRYIKYSSDYNTWQRRSDNAQMDFTLIQLCLVPYAPLRWYLTVNRVLALISKTLYVFIHAIVPWHWS